LKIRRKRKKKEKEGKEKQEKGCLLFILKLPVFKNNSVTFLDCLTEMEFKSNRRDGKEKIYNEAKDGRAEPRTF
jgi:hypothetical protein